jgi:predicted SAM-dependent methyltransferase
MIKINMGCGWRDFGKDWVHIDGGDYPHLDSTDIFNLPYEDNSVDLIYASHVIEYFNREEVKDVLNEWIRILKPNGTLRLAVPNFKNMIFLYHTYEYPLETFLGPLYGQMSMGDKTIYHKTTYDFDSLKSLLESLDMKNVIEYDWRETEHSEFDDHSQAYIPHMDKATGTLISLNMECKK